MLSPDLDGLKDPLLEERQVRLDFSYTASRDRNKISGSASRKQETNEIFSKVTYGLTDALQAYVSADIIFSYNFSAQYSPVSVSRDIFPVNSTFGAGLTYRPQQNFELFFVSEISPNDAVKFETYGAAGLSSVGYNKEAATNITLGATFLW